MRNRLAPAGLLGLVLVAVALSGCIGDAKDGKGDGKASVGVSEPPPPDAGEAAVTDTTGAIEGVVADSAFQPLAGARVTILKPAPPEGQPPNATTADVNGRFVFSTLAPGAYSLVADRTGYDSKGIGLTVKAGEVSKVTFLLPVLRVEGVPYAVPYEFGGFFGCGVGFDGGSGVGQGSLNPCFADSNNANVHYVDNLSAGLETIVVALQWNPTGGAIGQKLWLGVEYEDPQRCDELGTYCPPFATAVGTNPIVVRADREAIDAMFTLDENETKAPFPMRLRVFPGADQTGEVTVFFQQSFRLYVNLFYNEPAPEGFTGLPDL